MRKMCSFLQKSAADKRRYVKALSSEVISDVATLFDAVKAEFSEYVSEYVEEGSSLLFDYEKAQTMVEKLMAVTTAQEAYDSNIYYNRNSFCIGNQDWMDKVFKADEYGEYTLDEPTVPICYGPNTELNDQKLFRAQQYNLVVPGNPLNEVGSTIEITVKKEAEDGRELTWNIHSYIMMRTLKIKGDGCIEDTYSANNSPYNSNNRNIGTNTQEISATAVRTRQEAPTISYDDALSDGTIEAYSLDSGSTSVNKAKLRCMKRMSKEEYDSMVEAGTTRTDTIYCTWEEL